MGASGKAFGKQELQRNMRYSEDPRQNRLFDPFAGVISAAGMRVIASGWQGVLRHCLLEKLPVTKLGESFSAAMGTPTKELYSMAGLVFLTDFFDWTSEEASQEYMLNLGVQYALNLEPGAAVCSRTVERYQQIFRDQDLGAKVFDLLTTKLAELLEIDVSKQRLDSTHVFSHMASFGRTKLMAVAIKRFLTQVKRHAQPLYNALPEEFRGRYEVAQAKLFSHAKDADARKRFRQQAAEDLHWVIEHFAKQTAITDRRTYKDLQKLFEQQCEVVEGKIEVRAKTGGDCLQNPSDPDATYDGHKGQGYQVQITETYHPDNEVQLITAALPQTACAVDGAAVEPMLEQLKTRDLLPVELPADGAYGSDENVQIAVKYGVELIAPLAGRDPAAADPNALTLDDFAHDERTGHIDACPQSHAPLHVIRTVDAETGMTTTVIEMDAALCSACPLLALCPIKKTRDDRYELKFTDKDQRLAARRREQATEVFDERYASRSGIESTNSGLKNRCGLGKLRVRGRGAVYRKLHHKLAGWNMLRAAASKKVRAIVAAAVAKTLGLGLSAQSGDLQDLVFSRFGRPNRILRLLRSQIRNFLPSTAA